MSERIQHALTPEEWAEPRTDVAETPLGLLRAVALANDALPDGHQNKLTWGDADELHRGHLLLEYPERWERTEPYERVAVSMALANVMLKLQAILRLPRDPIASDTSTQETR